MSDARAVDKVQRQRVLRDLLATRALQSQADVVDALAAEGIACNQATVSRDLDDLKAVKVRGVDGSQSYRVRADLVDSGWADVEATIRQFVVDITASGNLVVLRTPPACAHPVASAIDLGGVDGAIATIAGDDTVLVVAAEGLAGADLAQRIRAHLGH
ncbi:arginine repressor [Salsipaludibacter albus]|uniref:arginine repressor n=1 Tax=Salsipaludibacter albus TaxID=2849650 RepID=UPI001EE40F57|nr:arginine repressor [Salsipaludibacter albus]